MPRDANPLELEQRQKALRVEITEIARATGFHENTVRDAIKGTRSSLHSTMVKIDETLTAFERTQLSHLLRQHRARPGTFADLLDRRDVADQDKDAAPAQRVPA